MQTAAVYSTDNTLTVLDLLTQTGKFTSHEAVVLIQQLRSKLKNQKELPARLPLECIFLNEEDSLDSLSLRHLPQTPRSVLSHELYIYAELFFSLVTGGTECSTKEELREAIERDKTLPMSVAQMLCDALLSDSKLMYTAVDQFLLLLAHACGISNAPGPRITLNTKIKRCLEARAKLSESLVPRLYPVKNEKRSIPSIVLEIVSALLIGAGVVTLFCSRS